MEETPRASDDHPRDEDLNPLLDSDGDALRVPSEETAVGDVLVDTIRLGATESWKKAQVCPLFQRGYEKRNQGLLTYFHVDNRLSAGEVLFPREARMVLLEHGTGIRLTASTPLRRWLEDNLFVRIEVNQLLWIEGLLRVLLDDGIPLFGTQPALTGDHEIRGTLTFLRDYPYDDKPDLEARFVLRGARALATTRG